MGRRAQAWPHRSEPGSLPAWARGQPPLPGRAASGWQVHPVLGTGPACLLFVPFWVRGLRSGCCPCWPSSCNCPLGPAHGVTCTEALPPPPACGVPVLPKFPALSSCARHRRPGVGVLCPCPSSALCRLHLELLSPSTQLKYLALQRLPEAHCACLPPNVLVLNIQQVCTE